MGYDTIEACDGTAGLKIIESGAPLDLLISDVGLPGLGGLQLADAARAAHPHLPILLITGYAGKSTETLQLAPNMELLRKPFTLDELAERVQAMFKGT
ncbi:response regulator [Methylocystis sp. SB2]|nr:response regulator [Methylocystis sp. SB2]ULO24075.1 response regulator [Methylocystis sp. SB2]